MVSGGSLPIRSLKQSIRVILIIGFIIFFVYLLNFCVFYGWHFVYLFWLLKGENRKWKKSVSFHVIHFLFKYSERTNSVCKYEYFKSFLFQGICLKEAKNCEKETWENLEVSSAEDSGNLTLKGQHFSPFQSVKTLQCKYGLQWAQPTLSVHSLKTQVRKWRKSTFQPVQHQF